MRLKKTFLAMALSCALAGCATEGGFNTEQALTVGAGLAQAALLDKGSVQQAAAEAAQEMDAQNEVLGANTEYGRRLDKIVAGLDTSGDVKFNFKVYKSSELNAFAMPDGTVRVYSGLMDAMPDDQVRAVLQHEIGHVRLNHSYNQMRKQLLTSSAFNAVAAVGGTIGDLTASQLGQIAYAYINARFSQADELESDAYAVKALHKMGEDPEAMKRAIQTLQTKVGAGGGFLSSHPSNDARVKNIESTIKKLK